MDIDLEELAAIIELLDKTDFTQFRFEKGELRIAVSRGELLAPEPSQPAAAPASAPVQAQAAATSAPTESVSAAPVVTTSAPGPAAPVSSDELADDEFLVRSPMLGTFYSAPKPGEAPFVQEGQSVAADAVLCIIEVMKLMNSVPAGEAGAIRRVLVRDGELVEFDQPLFVLGRSS